MEHKKNKKRFLIAIVAIIVSFALVGIVFAATSLDTSNYIVDVVKDSAVSKDENLQISEKIVKDKGKTDFDSKELNYEVELKNIIDANKNTEVSFMIDSSWSMGINDELTVGKEKAIELSSYILDNVANSTVSVVSNATTDNQGVWSWLTNNKQYIINGINGIYSNRTSVSTCSDGLDRAYSTFSKVNGKVSENVNRYIIVITDGTDDISEKVNSLKENDPNLNVISILVDISSTSYINNNVKTGDAVFLLLSDPDVENTIEDIKVLDSQDIYDIINKKIKNITVTNKFLNVVTEYFDITNFESTSGEVQTTKDGYTWTIKDGIGTKATEKLTFKLKLKNKEINADYIFKDISTNEEQNVTYFSYDDSENIKSLKGTDAREATDSTVIKLCEGYNLKIKAVNESNKDLPVQDVEFTIIGTKTNTDGTVEEICNIKKKTNSSGYITITPNDARTLRADGTITYTIMPNVKGLLGYTNTNSVSFDVTNSKVTRKLSVDDYNGIGIPAPDESKRLIEVTIPINTQKFDFEVRNQDLYNSNIVLSGSKFILTQPLLNDKYKMEKLEGVTDETGTVHFAPTVMTKDGTYAYYLEQETVSSSYNAMEMVRIDITFENGNITNITRKYNSDVDVSKVSEDHVLVIAKNECVMTDPFNLTINLKDEDTKNPLGPVTYLVKTIYSNGSSRAQYVQTDVATGSAVASIPANGQFNIEITEQSSMAGYESNIKTTVITVSRVNDQITIWNIDTNNAIVNTDTNKENIVIDFTSKKKLEQNMVRISLVDADETDVAVGKDIVYNLIDNETGDVYGPAISDRNGNLEFTVGNKTRRKSSIYIKSR